MKWKSDKLVFDFKLYMLRYNYKRIIVWKQEELIYRLEEKIIRIKCLIIRINLHAKKLNNNKLIILMWLNYSL